MIYYRRYSGDYLRDTARLTLTEHGAYTLLLDYYYSAEQPLPLEHDELYLMVRAMRPEDRKAVDKVLRTFFEKQADGYHQKRVEHEIEVSQKARSNGKGGGRPPGKKKTGDITGSETDEETEPVTGMQTDHVTGEGGGLVHPPTTNHQPSSVNLQPPTASDGETPPAAAIAGWLREREQGRGKQARDTAHSAQVINLAAMNPTLEELDAIYAQAVSERMVKNDPGAVNAGFLLSLLSRRRGLEIATPAEPQRPMSQTKRAILAIEDMKGQYQ